MHLLLLPLLPQMMLTVSSVSSLQTAPPLAPLPEVATVWMPMQTMTTWRLSAPQLSATFARRSRR